MIKDKKFTRILYKKSDIYEVIQKKFQADWGGRKPLIMDQMKSQMSTFLTHSKEIQEYLRNDLDIDDISSMGSISSADERDGEIIFSGHMHFFQIKMMIEKFVKEKRSSGKLLQGKQIW